MTENIVQVRKYTLLKVLSAVFYGLITAFLIFYYITALVQSSENAGWVAVGFILILCTYGLGYILPFIISLVGMILSIISRAGNACKTGTVVYFIIFTCLPVATWLIFFGLCYLLA